MAEVSLGGNGKKMSGIAHLERTAILRVNTRMPGIAVMRNGRCLRSASTKCLRWTGFLIQLQRCR